MRPGKAGGRERRGGRCVDVADYLLAMSFEFLSLELPVSRPSGDRQEAPW